MRLAWREIRRAKVRFAVLTVAVGLLAFLILLISSLTGSLITQFIGAIRNQSAEVLVYGEQARKNLEGSLVTPDQADAVTDAVGEDGTAAPLGEGTFTVTAAGERDDAVIIGFDLDSGVGAPTTLVEGRLPETEGEAVASEADADDGFGLGDTVRVEPDGDLITIVGVARDINYSVSPTLFVSYPTYERARLVRNPDAVEVFPSAVAVDVPDGDAQAVADAVNASVDGVEALTRRQASDDAPAVANTRVSLDLVRYVVGGIALVVTGFFFVILTVQKSQSLTLLRAIGARTRTLLASLLAQVVLVVGGGVVVATVLLALARTAFAGNAVEVRLDGASIVVTGIVLILLSAVASLGAVRRVLRIDPVRATQPGGVEG